MIKKEGRNENKDKNNNKKTNVSVAHSIGNGRS